MAMGMSVAIEPFCLRDAVVDDVPHLLALEAMFSGDRLSARQLRHHVSSSRARLRIVESPEMLAGYALLLFRRGSRIARLYSIAVDPTQRGAGLGAALLDDAVHGALQADCDTLRLEVREDNLGAIALYRRAGFREFGKLPGYYEDGGLALRFERRLI